MMSLDKKPTEQAKADALPNQESAYVEGASNAINPPLTAGPNDPFLAEKSSNSFVLRNSTWN
jgi:hypothetical protein